MEGERGGDAEPRAGLGAGDDVRGALRRQPVDGLLLSSLQSAEPATRSLRGGRALAGFCDNIFQKGKI